METHQRERNHPERLSALYQYHNAPEVAPAHGLEYDDTIYPSSDKVPVIREAFYDGSYSTGKRSFGRDGHHPRIIFGMKFKTFLLVTLVMALIVVGAAVGGAVGGKNLGSFGSGPDVAGDPTGTHISTSSTSTTAAATSATPTYQALSDCPSSNNTSYTSRFAQQTSDQTGLKFTKYCDLTDPLSQPRASKIGEAFVYSFDDCVEVCAGHNFWTGGENCTAAVYQVQGRRPGNCWIGRTAETIEAATLDIFDGTDVALITKT